MPYVGTSVGYKQAVGTYTAGEIKLAIAELQESLARDPENGAQWELLGTFAFASGDVELAQSAIERAGLWTPLGARSQLILATCYRRAGYARAALAIFRHVAALEELDLDLLEPLASGLGACGEHELALDVCRQAARRMPGNPDPLFGIVHYLRRLRRPLEIILPAMFRVHYLEPDNAEYRIVLAWMLHELDRSAEGASLLSKVPLAEFTCVSCLERMQRIFEHVGDIASEDLCRERVAELLSQPPVKSHRRDRKK